MSKTVEIYDSTLRDGAQGEGISFSVSDKIKIAKVLDSFHIDYIEAGFPASNPKDAEYFELMKSIELKNSRLCAFGSTIHYGVCPKDDIGMKALINASTPCVAIFGKASQKQVQSVLRISDEQNLSLIGESVAYLKECGKEVIFDAEHFFDGYAANPEYALKALECAAGAGADVLCLCDTNGATLPLDAQRITAEVCKSFPEKRIAVHFHDDIGCAVANSVISAQTGAVQIQGTFLGNGERCGNADLSVIIPNLKFKCGYEFKQDMRQLKQAANEIAELSNTRIRSNKPYIGKSAFNHKAGMHIDAVKKCSSSFEHIDPELVGNERKFLLSEMSGRGTLLEKVKRFVPDADKNSPELAVALDALKEKEHYGYHYEAADASLQLLLAKTFHKYSPKFKVKLYKTTDDYPSAEGGQTTSALIVVEVDGATETSASLGNGLVNALDLALRRALSVFYPQIGKMCLVDFKVRVIDSGSTTAAKVRVLIETTDGEKTWTTVGVSHDVIEASFIALTDSFEYKLSNL